MLPLLQLLPLLAVGWLVCLPFRDLRRSRKHRRPPPYNILPGILKDEVPRPKDELGAGRSPGRAARWFGRRRRGARPAADARAADAPAQGEGEELSAEGASHRHRELNSITGKGAPIITQAQRKDARWSGAGGGRQSRSSGDSRLGLGLARTRTRTRARTRTRTLALTRTRTRTPTPTLSSNEEERGSRNKGRKSDRKSSPRASPSPPGRRRGSAKGVIGTSDVDVNVAQEKPARSHDRHKHLCSLASSSNLLASAEPSVPAGVSAALAESSSKVLGLGLRLGVGVGFVEGKGARGSGWGQGWGGAKPFPNPSCEPSPSTYPRRRARRAPSRAASRAG